MCIAELSGMRAGGVAAAIVEGNLVHSVAIKDCEVVIGDRMGTVFIQRMAELDAQPGSLEGVTHKSRGRQHLCDNS